ncbi:MAG TPA: xylulokinase, partial [Burkholderiaceae bacterium]|nr:xylulokinase [Burkholderiaceae bacterium]
GAEAGGAMGAGRLAWLALGRDEREVCRPPTPRALFRPRAERHAALVPRLERFRELYLRTRELLPRA